MAGHIADLRTVKVNQLSSLMLEEGQLWLQRLGWDYGHNHELIKQYIRAGYLPGLVVMHGDEAAAYSYFVIENDRALMGNLFVGRKFQGKNIESDLAGSIIRMLQGMPGINRIEGQLMMFSGEDPSPVFRDYGFGVYDRNFLTLNLDTWEPAKKAPQGFSLMRWRDTMIEEAALVVYDSYIGGVDATFSYSFSRPDKCVEFVNNLVFRQGCGDFLPRMTTLAVSPEGTIAGIVIATKLSEKSGHLPQISVAPEYQGTGLGNFLVAESLKRYKDAGYHDVSLTVTKLNDRADTWYRRIGFDQTLAFNAYLWLRHQ